MTIMTLRLSRAGSEVAVAVVGPAAAGEGFQMLMESGDLVKPDPPPPPAPLPQSQDPFLPTINMRQNTQVLEVIDLRFDANLATLIF